MAFFDLSRTTIADWNKLGTFLTWTTRCWLACYRSAEPSLRNRGEIATESADDPLGEGAIVSAVARGLALRAGARRFGRGFAVLCAKCKSAMVFGTAALYLCYLLLAATTGHAQSPPPDPISTATAAPVAGLVPPYEINKIVRAAGFSPLAPPRREGATYVLRAIDYREILMRIVVDARSGAIQAVNRMVPAKPNGVVGAMPPAFGGRGLTIRCQACRLMVRCQVCHLTNRRPGSCRLDRNPMMCRRITQCRQTPAALQRAQSKRI